MPNWCSTTVVIYTEVDDLAGLDQLQSLYEKIQYMEEHGSAPNDFGNLWLGNVMEVHGKSHTSVKCRGSILSYEFHENYLKIWQADAWEPRVECWQEVLDKFYPNLRMVYLGEEPTSEIFINTDTSGVFFPERFRVQYVPADSESGCEEEVYFTSEAELINQFSDRTGIQFGNYDELTKWAFAHEIYISRFDKE